MSEEVLRYPIGKFSAADTYTPQELVTFIKRLEKLPVHLQTAIQTLTDTQLDTPYREGGWSVRQVVHHVADSHMNAFIRVKWLLTEDTPTIKAYFEKLWATTPETIGSPALSLSLISALHEKWVFLLRQLPLEAFSRTFVHPHTQRVVRLDQLTGMYAWHGDHHTAHITSLRQRMNWK